MKGAMYSIDEFYLGAEYPQTAQVSFEMPYDDWCEFQKSQIWSLFLEGLAQAQKGLCY